jgi:hypothetical protein
MAGDLGLLGKYYFWAGPLFCAILAMFFSFPIVGIAVANNVPPPILVHPFWGPLSIIWWFVWFAATLWYSYVLPQSDYLVLHEKGFRCRISHRHWEVPFAMLREVRMGWKTTRMLSVLMSVSHRRVRDFAKRAGATHLRLIFNNSKESQIPMLLVRFNARDLKEFFGYLMDRQPLLFRNNE